jgi:predicted RNase H-like nuclease
LARGKKLSKQAYAILPKIREVDEAVRSSVGGHAKRYEVHPELCFYFWNDRQPMGYSKRSGFGFAERHALTVGVFAGAAVQTRHHSNICGLG